jgi:hypothetical protein
VEPAFVSRRVFFQFLEKSRRFVRIDHVADDKTASPLHLDYLLGRHAIALNVVHSDGWYGMCVAAGTFVLYFIQLGACLEPAVLQSFLSVFLDDLLFD